MSTFVDRMIKKRAAVEELYLNALATQKHIKIVVAVIETLIKDAVGTQAVDFLNLKLDEAKNELAQITADVYAIQGRAQQIDEFIKEGPGEKSTNIDDAIDGLGDAIDSIDSSKAEALSVYE